MEKVVFYILAFIILVFSGMTVFTRYILRAAVYLLFVLIATAGIYFLLNYNFLAAVQLTVYAGGIVVLIVFSILLTKKIAGEDGGHTVSAATTRRIAFGSIAAISGALVTLSTLLRYDFPAHNQGVAPSDIHSIGTQLLNLGAGGYVLPFEVISILLLAAMVAAIVIAKRIKPND
jgi:NADH-quinone oxidoreductase subunit J